jgi:hypothetical protein
MPNQPKQGTSRHEISAIPDDLWARAQAVAAERGESLSAAVRRALELYVREGSK